MATNPYGSASGDVRRGVSSPRPSKGRGMSKNAKNTLCRNVTIYGYCRWEGTCQYYHPPPKNTNAQAHSEPLKKGLNVESPSFTPLQTAPNGMSSTSRSTTISPKAANAAVFTPKTNRATPTPSKEAVEWTPHEYPEFVPQGFDPNQLTDPSSSAALLNSYDPFAVSSSLPGLTGANQQAALNPYSHDAALSGAAYYQNSTHFTQPLQYHLYSPLGPHRENILNYQRTAHDFFVPDQLREDLQRKSEASRQILPNTTLPSQIEHFHSLVPLDTNNQRNTTIFGYPSWIYKAVSSKDGHTYGLRRLEGYRLTNEKAIRCVQAWKRINNGNVVTIHDAFTTRAFGDSSLIFVTDYFPLSKSLAEQHNYTPRYHGGRPTAHVREQDIWGYITQIANALKAIHSNSLAARVISPSKVIITQKNRIRLNGCAILDVVQFDSQRPLAELQQDDLVQLGRLILSIASNNPSPTLNMQKALDHITRAYSDRLKECVNWLLTPAPAPSATPQSPTSAPAPKDIDAFLVGITSQLVTTFDNTLHAEDTLTSHLTRELENGRMFRLIMKLGFINERPEYDNSPQWSETGERYYLKLFRDYVFHQVDANGNPAVDMAHVIACLNKLDAGTDEKISLVSRDEQNCLLVSYREVKRGIEAAFQELLKGGRTNR